MIRFIPDTWLEYLLRPFAMAAPNGWVYTEIVAPDFRFLLVVLLAIPVLIQFARGRQPGGQVTSGRGLAALGALTAAAFVPWLATSGNGRYFMPFLILVGPLCIGLAMRLPATGAMRGFAIVLALAVQAFGLLQNNPWKQFDGWAWISWKESPYFQVDANPQQQADATYVTISGLTFSLVAPQFPATVRWVNLSAFDPVDNLSDNPRYRRVAVMLRGDKLRLLQRAQVRAMEPETLMPNAKALEAINGSLIPHGVRIREPLDCKLLCSRALQQLTSVADEFEQEQKAKWISMAGFWDCALEQHGGGPIQHPEFSPAQLEAQRVFAKVEALCPRFLPPGQQRVTVDGTTMMRGYPSSDAALLFAGGKLYMKYERALNPQFLGRAEEILQPRFALDCNRFKGRAGLPWEREI